MGIPKWYSIVTSGVYRYLVGVFVANTLPLLAGNIATDLVCATSSHSLFSLIMVYLVSKIVGDFTKNTSYAEK